MFRGFRGFRAFLFLDFFLLVFITVGAASLIINQNIISYGKIARMGAHSKHESAYFSDYKRVPY